MGLSNHFEVLYAMQLLYPAELVRVISQVNLSNDDVLIHEALSGRWSIPSRDRASTSAQPVSTNP